MALKRCVRYRLVDRHGRAAAVDPAEPQKVLDAAAREGVTVATVLTTHKHWDHAGGNDKMKQLCPGIEVIGGVNDHVQGATRTVADGERLRLGDVDVTCIETPGCAPPPTGLSSETECVGSTVQPLQQVMMST